MNKRVQKYLAILTFSILIIVIPLKQTMFVLAADPPTLITPAPNEYLNDNTPTATWTTVSGALSYDIELAYDMAFTQSLGIQNVPGTTFIPPAPMPDDLYYWRVRTIDSVGPGDWSAGRRFTIDTVNPGIPILISPTNHTYINDSTPFFDWSDSTGVYEYTIIVDDDLNFASPLILDLAYSSEYDSFTTLPTAGFYWKVEARDLADNYVWSEVRDFFVDTTPPGPVYLSSPSNGSITDDVWAFECTTDPDAVAYFFEFGNNSSFDIVYASGQNTDPIYDAPLPDGDIFWHARAVDRAGSVGPWSETWMVTIDSTGPAPPIPIAPTNNSYTTDTLPRFNWTIVESGVEWQLSVSYLEDFMSWWGMATTGEYYDYDSGELAETTVYWRIRGRDALWNYGPWSDTMVFIVDLTPPDQPTLVSPTHEEVLSDNTPTLTWEAVDGAVEYRLTIDNNDDWSSPEVHIYTSNTYYTVPSALADDTYYWDVRAVDAAGNWGPWSLVRSFVIDTVIVPEFTKTFPAYLLVLLVPVMVLIRKLVKKKRE